MKPRVPFLPPEPLETRIAPAFTSGTINLSTLTGLDGARFQGVDDQGAAGQSVSAAGDVNGDGIDDFIIGAFKDNGDAASSGVAYVVFGRTSGFTATAGLGGLNGTNGFALEGAQGFDSAGFSVSGAGDVNGDGFDDVIVGAFYASGGGTHRGSVYVVFGHDGPFAPSLSLSALDGRNGFELTGVADSDYAGIAVSGAGDVNGDGFDDVIIGASGADEGGTISANWGAAYVVFGKAAGFVPSLSLGALDGSTGFKLVSPAIFRGVGSAVSGAGDINGDGLADVIVGMPYNHGEAFVVFGRRTPFAATVPLAGLDGTTGFGITGEVGTDHASNAVSRAGDINGDGFGDLIVGASDAGGIAHPGAAYVIYGKASFTGTPAPGFALPLTGLAAADGFKITGLADGDQVGAAVSAAGDVNGDGVDDLIVGAPGANGTATDAGAAYVVFGGATLSTGMALDWLDGASGFKINGQRDGDGTGTSVRAAGDVNGDGFADVIVGAPADHGGGGTFGAGYVVFGGPSGAFSTVLTSPNGKTATFTDVDGDFVTVKVSKGALSAANFSVIRATPAEPNGQLLSLTLGSGFDGADVSITAKRAGGGDGRVNVGFINAVGVDLGNVTVAGDLGGIWAGDADDGIGLKSLTAGSLGVFGGRTADTGAPTSSLIYGPVGAVKIAGDVSDFGFGVFNAATPGSGSIASFTLGGSLIGGRQEESGEIFAAGAIGKVSIAGDLVGTALYGTGSVFAKSIGSFTLGGSLLGGAGEGSGAISANTLGSVAVGGSQVGGAGSKSGVIAAFGNLGKVTIKGDQLGGLGSASGSIYADNGGNIASVTIGGDVRGGRALFSGGIFANGLLGPVTVKGDVIGTAEQPLFLRGGGPLTGPKSLAIAGVNVGGDFEHAVVLGGYTEGNASVNGHAQIGAISVGGDWIASSITAGLRSAATGGVGAFGNGDDVFIVGGPAGVVASIKSVTIKGAARGTFADGDRFGIVAEQIGSVSIGGAKVALTAGPGNDLAAIAVGATPDFVVRELSRTAVALPPAFVATPAAGPRSAFAANLPLGTLTSADGAKFSGLADTDYAGQHVSSAGDVNGDGFGDFIIAADRANAGGTYRGQVYVVFGAAGGASPALSALDGANGFTFTGTADTAYTGSGVSGAGDVNGDGFDDLVIGAPAAGGGYGQAYVIYGRAIFPANLTPASLDGQNGYKLTTSDEFSYSLGASVSGAGDMNGDGFDDFIVGASNHAYLVFGDNRNFAASRVVDEFDGHDGARLSSTLASFGTAVSGAGDVNGDGFDDVIIGAQGASEGGTSRGAAVVLFGRETFAGAGNPGFTVNTNTLTGSDGFKLSGVANNDRAGFSVGGAGDVNGDGFADVIVGANGADEGGSDRGAAYVVFGKASGFGPTVPLSGLNGSDGFKLSGVANIDRAGHSVDGAGDVNGDGFADVIVGAPLANEGGPDRGAAYVVFGRSSFTGTPVAGFAMPLSGLTGSEGFRLSGESDGDRVAQAVSAAGDVNGDGFADFIVGAPGLDAGGTDRGGAYVLYGGPSGEFIDPTFSADHKTARWTDVDGDLVTLKVSKGALDAMNFQLLAKSTSDARAQLLSLSLGSAFEGADVSLTAKRAGGGDGKVNVGFLNASLVDLGNVTVSGDLGKIVVGDGDVVAPVKSLTLGSLGVFGARTQESGGNLVSQIFGSAGAVKIAGDVREAQLIFQNGAAAAPGRASSVTIGGSVFGGKAVFSGLIAAQDALGPVKIGGDLTGGAGAVSGYLESPAITSVSVGGSMLGGAGYFSGGVLGGAFAFGGSLNVTGRIGDVTLGGDQRGGSGAFSGAIVAGTGVGKVNIKRDQVGGTGGASALLFTAQSGANITSVTIGGDARGGDAVFSGGLLAGGTLGAVAIKGDVMGTAKHAYLIRGSGPLSGTASVAIARVKVGGDFDHALILAGYGPDNIPANGHAQIGAISVGGDWIASSATAGLLTHSGALDAVGVFGNDDDVFINGGPSGVVASIASITIKGRATGTLETGDRFGIVAESIGSATIGGIKLTLTAGVDPAIAPGPDFVIREAARL